MWTKFKLSLSLMVLMAYFMPSSHKTKDGQTSYLLVDDSNYVYRWKRTNKKSKVWNCCCKEERNCRAEVKTNLEVSSLFLASARRLADANLSLQNANPFVGTNKSSCWCQLRTNNHFNCRILTLLKLMVSTITIPMMI